MPKPLRPGDVKKLQNLFCRISSLRNSLSMLNDDAPVLIGMTDVMGRYEKFYVPGVKAKNEIAVCIERLLKEEKDAIRKKYDIDIK